MQAGKLNSRVLIQKPSGSQDSIGQPTGWVNLISSGDGKLWADIRYLRGLEAIKAGAQSSIASVSIRIRWRTDVTPDMRVLYGSTVYQIKAVLPDEQGREHTDLVCEAVQ